MLYNIRDTDGGPVEAAISRRLGGGEYVASVGGREEPLRVLSAGPGGAEFILGQRYHSVRYLRAGTASVDMVVDGIPVQVGMHSHLDGIVYKNSGGAGAGAGGASGNALKSQIPGKVVEVSVEEGAQVKRGDQVAVLESMKMQVAVKSHKDGTVRSVRARRGASIAKNDVIAEIE